MQNSQRVVQRDGFCIFILIDSFRFKQLSITHLLSTIYLGLDWGSNSSKRKHQTAISPGKSCRNVWGSQRIFRQDKTYGASSKFWVFQRISSNCPGNLEERLSKENPVQKTTTSISDKCPSHTRNRPDFVSKKCMTWFLFLRKQGSDGQIA